MSLAFYSGTFMRYSMAVTPKNYLLFLCHFINFNSQLVQGYRWYDYWQYVHIPFLFLDMTLTDAPQHGWPGQS